MGKITTSHIRNWCGSCVITSPGIPFCSSACSQITVCTPTGCEGCQVQAEQSLNWWNPLQSLTACLSSLLRALSKAGWWTQPRHRKVPALQQVHQHHIAHTRAICHLQGFVISPSMDQWNYKLIMHSQAWIIAHIKTTYEVF